MVEGNGMTDAAKAFYDTVLGGSMAVSDVDGIDTATGCTMTAKGILNAVKGAIAVSQMDRTVSGNTYTYTVSAEGFDATKPMKIKIVVDKASSKVTKVEVLEYEGETEYFGKDMIEGNGMTDAAKAFHDKYLSAEFTYEDMDGVDTATGCTMTTKGIVSAIRKAIAATK